jgi:hypothetical protein
MSTNVAVIVCGDRQARQRDWRDTINRRIADSLPDVGTTIVIHGDAPGVDRIAAAVAAQWELVVLPMPAQWDTHGNAAGPMRNQKMLTVLQALGVVGYEIKVIAFHNDLSASKGTAHMVKIARDAGIPVELYDQQGERLA